VASYRQYFFPQTLLQSGIQPFGHARFQLSGRDRQRFETRACTLEKSLEGRLVGLPAAGFGEAHPGLIEGVAIHGRSLTFGADVGMKASELDYELPSELIAQHPVEPRDSSRLLVYRREDGEVRHELFRSLPELLPDGTLVVVNDTRVVPARLRLRRPGGGEAEVLLLERLDGEVWEALARPSRKLRPGMVLGAVELLDDLGEGRWRVRLEGKPAGEAPLPPYITERLDDPERYQTVYAEEAGSAAAPTAGLHFTPELLSRMGVERVTLHVGLDTFRPITAETLSEHEIHSERYEVAEGAWERIRSAAHVTAVGTTTVRVLESLARGAPLAGRTSLFITPGFAFRRVDALVTNFHLPRSSLLALAMAFAGVEETRRLYRIAIEERYRFYSFGDAMLIL
jgi:S-adenosylmethionine:tRNA ribosyltransferase-isomerase